MALPPVEEWAWPVWVPVPGRYPWRLKSPVTGDLLRDASGRAYVFHSPEAALKERDRLYEREVKRERRRQAGLQEPQ